MTPWAIEVVNAWIARQTYSWLTPERTEIIGAWVTIACELRDSQENTAGRKAALSGILLALVRQAWGEDVDIEILYWNACSTKRHLDIESDSGGVVVVIWKSNARTKRKRLGEFQSNVLGCALALALEAAPKESL